ncbi:apelin receptor 2 [Brachyhypopomus gauderio]|uniref:apelin receptor 2 n=1 Tax=Brachyhypopomus gauderio TaxID=698409 RepID=UPI0040439484
MSELEWPITSPSPSPSALPLCDYSEWHATRVLIPAVYLLAFVTGTLGNSLVLWVYLGRHTGGGRKGSCFSSEQTQEPPPCPPRPSRSVTECLISSLALADLVFIMTLPLWAVYTALDYHWPFGSALCRVSSYLVALNMYASVFSLTGLSMERYHVIARGHSRGDVPGRAARARWVVGGVWAASCILALPALLLRTVLEVQVEAEGDWQEGEAVTTQCLCDMDYSGVVSDHLDPAAREEAEVLWSAALGLKSTLLGFLLPLTVLLLCYCSLGRLLSQHFGVGPRADQARQRRLLRVICTLVLAFVLCWLPFHANKMLSVLVELEFLPYSCDFDRWLMGAHPYAICLGYANSCLNPLLYAYCDPTFRQRCQGLVRHICRRDGCRAEQGREPLGKGTILQSGTNRETEEEELAGVQGHPNCTE